MDDKRIAKRYLITAVLLYFCGTAFLAAIIFAGNRIGLNFDLSFAQVLLLSFVLSLIPLGAYTGVLICGLEMKEMSVKLSWAIILFLPVMILAVTIYGILMIIPSVIVSLKTVFRG